MIETPWPPSAISTVYVSLFTAYIRILYAIPDSLCLNTTKHVQSIYTLSSQRKTLYTQYNIVQRVGKLFDRCIKFDYNSRISRFLH